MEKEEQFQGHNKGQRKEIPRSQASDSWSNRQENSEPGKVVSGSSSVECKQTLYDQLMRMLYQKLRLRVEESTKLLELLKP